jgi:hypothetical protein
MNTTPRSRATRFQALPLLLVALLQPATTGSTELQRPLSPPSLSLDIAEQGNRALRQIQAESRLSLRQMNLPVLPAAVGQD